MFIGEFFQMLDIIAVITLHKPLWRRVKKSALFMSFKKKVIEV